MAIEIGRQIGDPQPFAAINDAMQWLAGRKSRSGENLRAGKLQRRRRIVSQQRERRDDRFTVRYLQTELRIDRCGARPIADLDGTFGDTAEGNAMPQLYFRAQGVAQGPAIPSLEAYGASRRVEIS